ncbi:MAG: type II toxin-antitoxin system VapC family toxin [Gammaproteobacteria bacterium]|nr:type II toxin-antitoxin system VapC family toxin [Gammaproteobacteria bacterium]
MILLDTNVISASMRAEGDANVTRWMDRQPASTLFLSAVTVDEIIFGIEVLPAGRRRSRLARIFAEIIGVFSGRVLTFDTDAAIESAGIRSQRQQKGLPMSLADSQIAGIARSNGFSLATMNLRDFAGIDLTVIEPR